MSFFLLYGIICFISSKIYYKNKQDYASYIAPKAQLYCPFWTVIFCGLAAKLYYIRLENLRVAQYNSASAEYNCNAKKLAVGEYN